MTNLDKNQETLPSLKVIVSLIIATGVVVSGVWGFFFVKTMALKDEKAELLKEQNAKLQEVGVVPEAVKRLEQRLIPLTLAFAVDHFNGRVKMGKGQEGPTELTMLIIKAEELRKEKKFDLASAKLDELNSLYSDFKGTSYFRFLIERDKDHVKEATDLAEQAIRALPDDARVLPAYEFAIKAQLNNGNKKRAEELCLSAIHLDPKNERRLEFFKQAFGYQPSVPEE